jgi:antitoxin YefM
MISIRLDTDVHSLSEFRARVAEFVHEVCLTGRPLLLTQRGRGVAIVIDVREFEAMRERLESLEKHATAPAAAPAAPPAAAPAPAAARAARTN